MKYLLIALTGCCMLVFTGCGGTFVTPEFVDPADAASSPLPEESRPEASGAESGSESSAEQNVSSEDEKQESIGPAAPPAEEVEIYITEENFSPVSEKDGFLYQDFVLTCDAGRFKDAGRLNYQYVQIDDDSEASAKINEFYRKDLEEWRGSVLSAAHDNAALSIEENVSMEPYEISLSASVYEDAGIISVTRYGMQVMDGKVFPFMMNECFEAGTGGRLELWDLFSGEEEKIRERVLAALEASAERAGIPQAAGGGRIEQYFSPADFACSDSGMNFYLYIPDLETGEEELVELPVSYHEMDDILSYPLGE